ncbi:putative RNA methyltransferase [Paenibacillus sp. J2TS4]|uniref:putative RNA methyltransferase n=1 Tax=Paenibacillus sp. J2TS4 TaxID=2807194 RepID=UPI001B244893|nr:methyltransferase domain-containing protein [Paenibacillus sp. J2TS4]GIP33449.1 hypothetical protein J2TS4_26590 [Paenibacillus sp. J2TS4]
MFENTNNFSEYEQIFACPLCSKPMKVVHVNSSSLICSNHHCFDISKRGYVNWLTRPHRTKYDKRMFEARRQISASGYFEPLISRICEIILPELDTTHEMLKILDAGCGEGSHLIDIQQKLVEQAKDHLLGVGIDISKEGIHMASRRRPPAETIWCVADLAKCPFADQSFRIILNILSPSNYSEFQRMLVDDGMVIKVIPESRHLQELRERFDKSSARDAYSNENIVEHFRRNFKLVDTQHIQYGAALDQANLEHLIHMTPLSWGISEEDIKRITDMKQAEITFDFAVLLGRKK